LSIIRKNGDIRYLEVFRKQVLWNGEMQFQALYADITGTQAGRKKIWQESNERYRIVVENAHEAIINHSGHEVGFCQSCRYGTDRLFQRNINIRGFLRALSIPMTGGWSPITA